MNGFKMRLKCYKDMLIIYMCYNRIIHDEISKEYSYILCPFCNKQINERKVKCCDNQDIINEDGKIVCRNCQFVMSTIK